jgi:hypothetical protein
LNIVRGLEGSHRVWLKLDAADRFGRLRQNRKRFKVREALADLGAGFAEPFLVRIVERDAKACTCEHDGPCGANAAGAKNRYTLDVHTRGVVGVR